MSLEFLTPVSIDDRLLARSPMESLARAAGARFEQRDGWNVPVTFAGRVAERRCLEESVAFVDRSSMTKLELQGDRAVLASVSGVFLERGLAVHAEGTWWCSVTPGRLLALTEPGNGEALRDAIRSKTSGTDVTVVDVTCGLAALGLIGPGARELLARFCAIDVRPSVTPVAGFRPGSIARTPGYLLREAEDRLLIMVGWALGEYLWQVVADAAGHLGGGPVGADAIVSEVPSA